MTDKPLAFRSSFFVPAGSGGGSWFRQVCLPGQSSHSGFAVLVAAAGGCTRPAFPFLRRPGVAGAPGFGWPACPAAKRLCCGTRSHSRSASISCSDSPRIPATPDRRFALPAMLGLTPDRPSSQGRPTPLQAASPPFLVALTSSERLRYVRLSSTHHLPARPRHTIYTPEGVPPWTFERLSLTFPARTCAVLDLGAAFPGISRANVRRLGPSSGLGSEQGNEKCFKCNFVRTKESLTRSPGRFSDHSRVVKEWFSRIQTPLS